VFNDYTIIGEIESINGTEISVRLNDNIKSNLLIINGITYKIGQIGSFLKVHLGYATLYGIISQTGSSAIPDNLKELYLSDFHSVMNNRWITISLVGELYGGKFERGISQYPTSGDVVHIVTEADLELIYGGYNEESSIEIGTISSTANLRAKIDLNKFITRHSAIVGSTGSGKSNAVNMILQGIKNKKFPSTRILVIDPHGEYNSSLEGACKIYKVNSNAAKGESELYLPYWALPSEEFLRIFPIHLTESQVDYVLSKMMEFKLKGIQQFEGEVDAQRVTVDSPLPFSLKKFWYELDKFERVTLIKSRDMDTKNAPTITGNPDKLESDVYPMAANGGGSPFLNYKAQGIQRFLDGIRTRILDTRYDFMLTPGKYEPDLLGNIEADLSDLLVDWFNHEHSITILDLSGIPSEIMSTITGILLKIVYDALYWGQDTKVGGKEQPLLVVLEEAHNYLRVNSKNIASRTIQQIAKEGRKYGIGLCLVSQRPSELDETVLSQCGTMISLRMNNNRDKAHVLGAMQDEMKNMVDMLSGLKTGEALITGESVNIPSRIRFDKCKTAVFGSDPIVTEKWNKEKPEPVLYKDVLKYWRNQQNRR